MCSTPIPTTRSHLLCFGLSLVLPATSVRAAVKTWDGGAATGNWSDAANWNADGVPTSSDAVILDNTAANPVPQISAQAGANCGTLTIDGTVNATFLNYGGATPLVTNLYGASVNAANTGPLVNVTSNAPALVSANKINFTLRTNGEVYVAAGKALSLSNSYFSQNGTRSLTKTGAGTVQFSGSGSQVVFTGGLNMAEGIWNAGADTLDLPTAGLITFTNASGVAATITSTNSHSIAGLSGGNSNSEIYATGGTGLTITGSAVTTFSGRIRGATKLNHTGTGTLTLNGDNTTIGATSISAGTLALGAAGTLGNTPSISIAAGAAFDVSAKPAGFTLGSGKSITGSGAITGKLIVADGATVSPGTAGVGELTISNGLTLGAQGALAMDLNGPASHDALVVTGGDVSLAGALNATMGYAAAIGDTLYLVRNTGGGSTTGTLSGAGDGGKLDIGGKWWRVSFTSDFGGSGFSVGGAGNDLAIRRIDDPSPSGLTVGTTGATNEAVVALSLTWIDNSANETGFRIYRVLDDGSLELVTTLGANATTFGETVSNYTSYSYAVQAFNSEGTLGDISYATPFQAGTSFASRHDAMLDFLSTEVPNLGQFGGGPHRIGRTGFWCATGRMLRGDTATGLSYITTAVEDANAEGANAGFSMWPGMDAYMRWNHLFPQSLKDRYQQIYVGADAYDNGSTPNQRFMLAVASYLANGVWGASVNSTSSAANGVGGASGRDFILSILNKTPFYNHEEHNASHYLQYSLAAIETLAQFAQDAEVRDKARMVVTWSLAEASAYMQNGRWCVPNTRGRPSQQQYDYDITGWTWHLLFGGPDPASYFDSFATAPFLAPEFPAPLSEILSAGRQRTRGYTRRSLAQRYLSGGDVAYFKQCWMTPGYALWSQVEGDVTYNADGSLNLLDVDTAGIQDGYQGIRWGLAWDDPPWFDSVLRITSPTTYSGSTGGISIWEDTLQHEDTMVAVYNMPAGGGGSTGNNGNWANEWLTGHIPTGWLAITDESASTGRIFLHYEKLLVSIYLSRTFSWATDFTVSGVNKAALAIETAPVAEFTQSTATARLAAFRAAVTANAPDISGITNAAPRFVYTNRHGRALDLTYGTAGKINGVTVDYQSWPMLDDPWMHQSQDGHLHLFGPNRTVTCDFHNWTQNISTRPSVSGNTAATTVAASPVDVDLSTRVNDAETPDANLAFTVSNPVGGTVTLLPDGKTARFTPTAGISGAASFDFTASDRGMHPDLVWHYDFEPPAALASNLVSDASLRKRDATLSFAGSGTAALETDVPAALGSNSTRSIRLNEANPNAARLQRAVTRSNLEMSNGSWTFATWFKRATRTSEDFIFYLGGGDGFGGGGEELYVYAQANNDIIRLQHYNPSNTNDLNVGSPATVTVNTWHHLALTYQKTADNTGVLRFYLNGVQVGAGSTLTLALQQDTRPIVLGGHPFGTSAVNRYFNGWLDDAVLFRGAMTSTEVASLAKQSVATASGLVAQATVTLNVLSRQEEWRQQYFGTTESTGDAADSADPNHDGEINLLEFATGQNPLSATRANPALARNGGLLEFTYTRANAALSDGFSFIVEWSDTLAPGSWSASGVSQQILTDNGTVQSVKASVAQGTGPKRFLRLRVVRP